LNQQSLAGQALIPVAVERQSVSMLLPIVFVGGMCSIGIELAASRLLAPYFGTSTLIWANLIGLTLTYLAIGYYIGGRVADRYPSVSVLYGVTVIAGLFVGLIPFIARPILEASLRAFNSLDAGAFYGSLVGVILLFAVPVTLLGFVTPYGVRLRVRSVDSSGNTAGRIYALSTVGSIVGSFLPVLVLVPLFGTTRTFLILAAALIGAGTLGFALAHIPRAAGGAGLALLGLVTIHFIAAAETSKPPYRGELIEEAESEYHYIQVLEENGRFLLALNEGHAIHSIYDPDSMLTGGPWDYFLLGPLFVEQEQPPAVENVLLIGLAGGTASRSILSEYPEARIDGVEIDEAVARLGEKYFAMSDPRLSIHISDGRYFLHQTETRYDLVGLDAYRQPYIPFHLATVEFFEEIRDQMTTNGVVVLNAGKTETDTRLVDAMISTMSSVFEHVFVIDAARYQNSMIFATNAPASLEALSRNVEALDDESSLAAEVYAASREGGDPRLGVASRRPFTDDHAPVEWVIDQMILDAAREEIP
jgi:predicted membrane-bound spermidine synthase